MLLLLGIFFAEGALGELIRRGQLPDVEKYWQLRRRSELGNQYCNKQ
jgi:hypothetical protein